MNPPPGDGGTPAVCPPSVTRFAVNAFATCVLLAVLLALRAKLWRPGDPALVVCGAYLLPIVVLDVLLLRVHRRETTAFDWDKPSSPDAGRVATKLLGLAATLAPFALAYWTFPEYQGAFYDPFYRLVRRFAPTFLVLAVTYFTVADGHARDPFDVYWRLGRVLLGRTGDADRAAIANHYRGWLIKAYFFALFWVWLSNSTRDVVGYDLSSASWSNLRAYDFAYRLVFFVDLVIATVGYAMTYRALDTHIRSADATMLGWAVALLCYEPFFHGLFEKQYFDYGGRYFAGWLSPYPILRWAWAAAVFALIGVYVLATVAFGVRFSNLTNRGIVTCGPYRFTKHPAYVAKNVSWWLVSVPFVASDGTAAAVRRCLLLAAMNAIYFFRARTEERHLSRDPEYVAYARWIDEHGLFRFLRRLRASQ